MLKLLNKNKVRPVIYDSVFKKSLAFLVIKNLFPI